MPETKYKVTWSKDQNREPVIGDITTCDQLDFKNKVSNKVKMTYRACVKCNKPRWVQSYYPTTKLICRRCNTSRIGKELKRFGSKNPVWKGGRIYRRGYVHLRLEKSDPYYKMCGKFGYVGEHRLIIAKQLGRCLETHEQVHHINGIKDDNKPENLVLLKIHEHSWVTRLTTRIKELEKEIKELRNEKHKDIRIIS